MARAKRKATHITYEGTKYPVPANLTEAAAQLSELSAEELAVDAIQHELNVQVQALIDEAQSKAQEHLDALNGRFKALKKFAEQNTEIVTDDGKRRSVQLAAGQLGFRTSQKSFRITDAPAVIERIQALGKDEFLRQPPLEIDKEAMERQPSVATSIEGVSQVGGNDTFFIRTPKSDDDIKKVVELQAPSTPKEEKAAA